MSSDAPPVVVSSLHIYPVKSCGGISVQEASICATGFLWDRQWMVVNAETGRFLTQRQEPRLALIKPSLPPEASSLSPSSPLPPNASLSLSARGMEPLSLPLSLEAYSSLPPRQVAVWEWKGEAKDAGESAAQWVSKFLGRECRIVRFEVGKVHRNTNAKFAPGFEAAFADGYPFLVVSEASLASLNSRLAAPVSMRQFRPNIVVTGCPEFQEDRWKVFRIGGDPGVEFKGAKPCDRCQVPTIDQDTAESSTEPLETLRTFRTGKDLNMPPPFGSAEVFFGMNVVCQGPPESKISVGDAVQVVSLD